ncbi:MAG: FmdB family transcriptional regulator [Planctomycetota bacterium]
MPMYVYDVLDTDGSVCGSFEIIQKITADPLTIHPETGQPLRMKMQAPFVGKKTNGELPKADISDRNLEKLGFTKYKKSRQGGYEKVVGDGPDIGG